MILDIGNNQLFLEFNVWQRSLHIGNSSLSMAIIIDRVCRRIRSWVVSDLLCVGRYMLTVVRQSSYVDNRILLSRSVILFIVGVINLSFLCENDM